MIEYSYGIIPLIKQEGEWKVLMILHQKGHWAFPKGRPMVGEREKETAIRELGEETGLYVARYFELAPLEEHYQFERDKQIIFKKALYFLAEVDGELEISPEEVADARWVSLEEAPQLATFSETQRLCREVVKILH
ncbi:MAG: NUDIX domain-containing protein [Chlamydiota bacterium]